MKRPGRPAKKPARKSAPKSAPPAPEAAVIVERAMTEKEAAWLVEQAARHDERVALRPPVLGLDTLPSGTAHLWLDPTEPNLLNIARLGHAFGEAPPEAQVQGLNELARFSRADGENAIAGGTQAMLANMTAMSPADGLEAMLAQQMAMTHRMAIDSMIRANHAKDLEWINHYHNRANRLLRTFTQQLEAWNRHRKGPSEQRVTVQHVHVNDGGQAVVGDVTHNQAPPPSASLPSGAVAVIEAAVLTRVVDGEGEGVAA